MKPDRAAVVKSFRQKLEAANFGLGQVNDTELESWLFRSGPDHIHLLRWCLGQLDPDLRDRFQHCDENETEKSIIHHVKSFGLSQNTSAILGTSEPSQQDALWRRMLLLFRAMKGQTQSPIKGKNHHSAALTLTSILKSGDYLNLLHTKINLLPSEFPCSSATAIAKRDIEEELKAAVLRLEELQEAVNEVSSEVEEKSIIDRSVRTCEDYKEEFLVSYKKIQECYEHLVVTVFPALKKQPESPIAKTLGNYVEDLADNVAAFVQMLKSTENIHRMAQVLQDSSFHDLSSPEPSELQQCISRSHALVTEVLSLWRLHNIALYK